MVMAMALLVLMQPPIDVVPVVDEDTPTVVDEPWTAHDQWIELRGGRPSTFTAMGVPDRRFDLRRQLLQRERMGGEHRVHRDRPDGWRPTAIVLHATGSGEPGSGFTTLDETYRFFARPAARASAHFAIDRAGRVLQLVDVDDAAFHVATPGWNDVSIGIELLNDNSGEPYPAAQRAALTQLVRTLGVQFGIPVEGVVRHATVQPSDRRDPVAFPWRAWLGTLHDAR